MTNHVAKTVDDLIDSEIDNLIRAKKKITSALNRSKLVTVLREIVAGSECLEFSSKRSERYINGERPLLSLILVRDKISTKYPAQYEIISKSEDVNEQHTARSFIVQKEINSEIVNFFNLVMIRICKRDESNLPPNISKQLSRVEYVLEGHDIDLLQKTINNTLAKLDNSDGIGKELYEGYLYSIITAVSFPPEDEILVKDNIYVEISY